MIGKSIAHYRITEKLGAGSHIQSVAVGFHLKVAGSPLSPVIAPQFPDMQYLNGDRRVILDRFLS